MADRALVDAVAGELEAVIAELVEEVALQEARCVVRDPPAAKRRMHGEATEVGDAMQLAPLLEAHDAGPLAVDLDHETSKSVRLGQRAFHLGCDSRAVEC